MSVALIRDLWRDSRGNTLTTRFYTNPPDDGSAVAVELQNLSGAANVLRRFTEAGSGLGDGAFYPGATLTNVAILRYATSGRYGLNIWIPSPDSSIYLLDGETVDPSAVASLSSAVIAHVCDAGGNPVTSYVAGSKKTVALLPVPLQ